MIRKIGPVIRPVLPVIDCRYWTPEMKALFWKLWRLPKGQSDRRTSAEYRCAIAMSLDRMAWQLSAKQCHLAVVLLLDHFDAAFPIRPQLFEVFYIGRRLAEVTVEFELLRRQRRAAQVQSL